MGDVEAFMEQSTDGQRLDAGICKNDIEEVGARGIENDGRNFGVVCRDPGAQKAADTVAEEDNFRGRQRAGDGEVLPGGGGVLGHALLVGVDSGALAVAAVIEREEVEAEAVKGSESELVIGIGERAIAAGQIKNGV